MRVLLVADGRSPITRRWVASLTALQAEVVLVSTFPCDPFPGIKRLYFIPLAFSGLAGSQAGNKGAETQPSAGGLRRGVSRFRGLFLKARYRLGPLTIRFYARRFRRIVAAEAPHAIHALRIPFEGMLAAFAAPRDIPVLVSIWGNDLTLHARGSASMRRWTERTLARVDGLFADAHRDIRLAQQWGYPADSPVLVVPGSGGLDLEEIARGESPHNLEKFGLSAGQPYLVNPRGFRPGSVRNDVFFRAIPLIAERYPEVKFLCLAMEGQEEALRAVHELKIESRVRLLPYLPQPEVWQLFRGATASVSISAHDGTPNSLLEAMACGCFPIGGDIESLREWITPGVNGLLVEFDKPQEVAEAVILALSSDALRKAAARQNCALIRARAAAIPVREQIGEFLQRVLNK